MDDIFGKYGSVREYIRETIKEDDKEDERMMRFKIQADAYREYLAAHEIGLSEEVGSLLRSNIRICDFLANCEKRDIQGLIDMGVFNPYIVSYCRMAAREAGIDKEHTEALIESLRWLLDTRTSAEIDDR